jgi:predicted nucleic acid-binding protein
MKVETGADPTMDAFDADVLIYATVRGHDLGRRVLALFSDDTLGDAITAGVGSMLLLPELLTKPVRDHADTELVALTALLARLDLRPLDEATAELAVALGAAYGLRAADAVHLATAVTVGADRFLTNNRRDFPPTITEINVTYPDQLSQPDGN